MIGDLKRFLEQSREALVPWAAATIFNTKIRRNIKLAECPSHGKTIFEYASSCHGALDYLALAMEVSSVQYSTQCSAFGVQCSEEEGVLTEH